MFGERGVRTTVGDGQMQDNCAWDLILPNGFGGGFSGQIVWVGKKRVEGYGR